MWDDPSKIDTSLDSRAITFENPTGQRGTGGTTYEGRKGSPSRRIASGESVTLAEIDGPGRVRHIWMTFPPAPPEVMRGLWIEVFYNGAADPSVSVPCLDFFGLPHGRPVPYTSILTTAQEGRGFNSYIPMPFEGSVRIELTNSAERALDVYYQVDYTLGAVEPSYLHVSFRRENPTALRRDFTIAEGFRGPGRFLGCVVGIRVLQDGGVWYGEGEVKVYRDGDAGFPTICGTGLEDYVGSAWGLGAHDAPFAGTPLDVRRKRSLLPDLVGFYRWHVPDPIVFERDLRVTIQQIGMAHIGADAFDEFEKTHPVAGRGWREHPDGARSGIHERVDDYCAAAFVYCQQAQAVRRIDIAEVLADIGRLDYEEPLPMERFFNP